MFKFLCISIIIILLGSCAQQGILTGGDKDMAAPIVDTNKFETPINGTVNFTAQRIEIPFNEFVTLQDVKKQVIITPFLSTTPDIYVKGKKVIIDFKSNLEPNTTYIINFGDAIRDITEGNILKNYKYVFSTGTFLDSLKYNAFVYDAFTKKPVPDALVMLYKNLDDSIVKKQKPIYFAKTNSSGTCTIENIADAEYKVFVLLDENNNYLFDQVDEKIGFKLQTLIFSNDTSSLTKDTLGFFLNYPSKKSIVSSSYKEGKITLVLNTPITTFTHEDSLIRLFKDLVLNKKISVNNTRDTLTFWLTYEQIKTQDLELNIDEFGIAKLKISPLDEKKQLNYTTNALNNLKPKENLIIKFDEPIEFFDTSKIKLLFENKHLPYSIKKRSNQEIEITAQWKEDESYEFKALPKAFKSIYKTESDTLHFLFDQLNAQKFGSVNLTLEGKAFEQNVNFIVLLLQNNKVVFQTQYNENSAKSVFVENLLPNKYTFCIIFDSNKNGIWDTGNYFNKQQPERIDYYTELIDIRKGWDTEVIWKIEN
jgi:hypothetical protein